MDRYLDCILRAGIATLSAFINLYFLYSKVPAFLHVTDIAGLVQGAHEGQVCMSLKIGNIPIYFNVLSSLLLT